jgi:tetratricopeptide (TPR) repeat protein
MSSASELPEESNPSRKKAQTYFQFGNDAALKSNYDYAIQMYQEACKLEPENLAFRQALRGIERRKFNNEPSKVGKLVGARTQPIRMRARSAKSKGKGAEALAICEEAFVHNPWDVGTARDAAEAAEGMGALLLAQWLLESVQAVANDAEFFRHLAHVHEEIGAFPKAIAAFERVKKINPNDEDVNRKINALAASATIKRSGMGEALDKAAPGKAGPESQAETEAEAAKQPQQSPEQRWMKEIKENPKLVGPYLQFADYLKGRGKLDDAEKVLARGVKIVPDDPSLQFSYAEIHVARLERALKDFEKRVREKPDDEATKAKLEQLRTSLAEYEVKEARRRVKLNPTDAKLNHELGLKLARVGQHKDAIAAFQVARSSPTLKVQAMYQAGLSFEAEGVPQLAERSYQDALKAADPKDLDLQN